MKKQTTDLYTGAFFYFSFTLGDPFTGMQQIRVQILSNVPYKMRIKFVYHSKMQNFQPIWVKCGKNNHI